MFLWAQKMISTQHKTHFHVRIEGNIASIIQFKTWIAPSPTTTPSLSHESVQKTLALGFYFFWITSTFCKDNSTFPLSLLCIHFILLFLLMVFLPSHFAFSWSKLCSPPLATTFPVLPVLLRSVLSISKDVASPVIREHLHNRPMVVKPVPRAAQPANDLR